MLLATREIRTIWFRQYPSWICTTYKKKEFTGVKKSKKSGSPPTQAFNQKEKQRHGVEMARQDYLVSSTGEVYSELYLWRSTGRPAICWPRGKEAKLRVPRADRGGFWFVQVGCRLVPSIWPKIILRASRFPGRQ